VGRHNVDDDLGPHPARGRRAHRARPAPRLVDVEPIPLGSHRRLAARGRDSPRHRDGAGRAGPAVAGGVRARHARRSPVVDRVDQDRAPGRGRRRRRGRGRPRRRLRLRAARRHRARAGDRALGGAPAGARPHRHGLDRPGLLRRRRQGLYDRSGNIAATIWCDGRVVGCWAQRPDGEIARRLLVDVGREAAAAIEAESERLGAWLGPTRITPRSRVRTPIERELVG
jgi:hypothetical protein